MARVAFVSPLPPERTGIATYAAMVLDALADSRTDHTIDRVWPLGRDALARVREADVAVYQIGNNVEFHGDIYALSVWNPSIVVLHDLAIDGLVWGLGEVRSPLAAPARAEAMLAARAGAAPDDPLAIPWCAQLVRRARAVIVHSRFAKEYLEGIGCRTPIVVAPHPVVERDAAVDRARERRSAMRSRVTRGDEVLVGVAGDLNATKGIEQLLEALPKIHASVRLVLVGRKAGWDLDAAIRASAVGDRVTVVRNVEDDEFLAWLCAFDVLVNLRFPHRGETSGSLVRALHAGTPTIVSAIGTYLEVPDDVVVRIAPGPPDPMELAAAIDGLAEDRSARDAMGERARGYASEALAPGRTAAGYLEAIDKVLALRADPARTALARWAVALRDLGVSPHHVERGFGIGYADALAEMRAGPRARRGS
jgi:glycosyltransferase involved in cell wall biosynthesis